LKGTDLFKLIESADAYFESDRERYFYSLTDGGIAKDFSREIGVCAKEANIGVRCLIFGATKGGGLKLNMGGLKVKNGGFGLKRSVWAKSCF